MLYRSTFKDKAICLRKKGYSLNEISSKLDISKSTASLWLSNIELSPFAKERLIKRKIDGQKKAVLCRKNSREKQKVITLDEARQALKRVTFSKDLYKIFCALLWWCEGNKSSTIVRFTSSDPSLIKNYLICLRRGFKLNESKFRAIIHLHEYHDDETQKKYWSKIIGIPQKQFWKSFVKQNTGKKIHKDYQGCVAITYYDARIAKELEAIYNSFNK